MPSAAPRKSALSKKPSFANDSSPPLHGRVALVTGATRGIGLAIARTLASAGCNLILTARDESALRRVSRELGQRQIKVRTQPCDVRSSQSVDELFRRMRREFKTLDVLINNAGIGQPNLNIDKLPLSVWQDVIDTNLTSMFLVTQAALPLMKRGGTIVNNLSIAAARVFPGLAAYNASKHGALGFTNTLREDLRPRGIRVIALLPGATDTAIWNTLWPEAPRKKMMSPAAIAEALVSTILLPENATVETLEIMPSAGTL